MPSDALCAEAIALFAPCIRVKGGVSQASNHLQAPAIWCIHVEELHRAAWSWIETVWLSRGYLALDIWIDGDTTEIVSVVVVCKAVKTLVGFGVKALRVQCNLVGFPFTHRCRALALCSGANIPEDSRIGTLHFAFVDSSSIKCLCPLHGTFKILGITCYIA